jgi:hypothetical protein
MSEPNRITEAEKTRLRALHKVLNDTTRAARLAAADQQRAQADFDHAMTEILLAHDAEANSIVHPDGTIAPAPGAK